jgi:hypothetical protein
MSGFIEDIYSAFAAKLGVGRSPLPPRQNTIQNHIPDLQGLSRDSSGIIMQMQDNDTLNGGDSAHRMGVSAFCNSLNDQQKLSLFENNGIMVRHPTRSPWNNSKNCTRDQLIGFAAGCWRAGLLDINQRLLHAHATRSPPFTCQDTENDYPGTTKQLPIGDPLGPDDIMYLKICAGDADAVQDTLGQIVLQVSILRADKNIEVDKNNL